MSKPSIPKMHTIRRQMAEEVAYLLYASGDKGFKKEKTREIEDWLADGNFFGDETPAELAREWQEFDRESASPAKE